MKSIISALMMMITLGVMLLPAPGRCTEAVQVQPSSTGNFMGLLSPVKIKKGVLTITFIIKNVADKEKRAHFSYKDVYFIDPQGKKNYFALKDSTGQIIAGPKKYKIHGGEFDYDLPPNKSRILWIKFPAPPETVKSIDIFFPGFLPFEDVPLPIRNQHPDQNKTRSNI